MARSCPSIPAVINSSMIKESFCSCVCRLAVPSSRDRLLSLMDVHVYEIQEGGMQPYRAGRLIFFPENPVYIL